jgi:SH3-like domain-containing protein
MKRFLLSIIVALGLAQVAIASDRGSVTNLPIPRYVSIKTDEVNVRRGPSLTHRIDWVFQRKGMPLEVTAEHGHWRRVRDRDGAGGWVHYSLLSGARSVIIERDMLNLHLGPDQTTPVTARLELGVVARLGACDASWCRLTAGGFRGWAPKGELWGVKPDEIRD